MLKTFVDEGWLEAIMPESEDADGRDAAENRAGRRRDRGMRYPLLSVLALLVMLAFGAFRWAPLMFGEMALIGLAEPVDAAETLATGPVVAPGGEAPVSWLDDHQLACRNLRLRQVQAEVDEAARHYHATHGRYPGELDSLVSEGMLAPATGHTIQRLGWQYAQLDRGQSYRLEM
jgi:hypothetical protein